MQFVQVIDYDRETSCEIPNTGDDQRCLKLSYSEKAKVTTSAVHAWASGLQRLSKGERHVDVYLLCHLCVS